MSGYLADGGIYYFSDSPPILTERDLEKYGTEITYDLHYGITTGQFHKLCGGYFMNFPDDGSVTIIIEFKMSVFPNRAIVENMLSQLSSKGQVVCVNPYGIGESGVSDYVECERLPLEEFIEAVVQDIGEFSNYTMFIDPQFVDGDITDMRVFAEYMQDDTFFDFLLRSITSNDTASLATLMQTADRDNIIFWMHYTNLRFFDFRMMSTFEYEGYDEFVEERKTDKMFAIGIWTLDPAFYSAMKIIQDEAKDASNELTIYVFLLEPITYAPGQLEVITSEELGVMTPTNADAAGDLDEWLYNIFG